MAKDKRKISAEEMDQDAPCVCCSKPSGEKKGTPIDQRSCYIKDVGQLCKRCYNSAYA